MNRGALRHCVRRSRAATPSWRRGSTTGIPNPKPSRGAGEVGARHRGADLGRELASPGGGDPPFERGVRVDLPRSDRVAKNARR